jgi:hypothetical protein
VDRARDVLEPSLAEILEPIGQLVLHVIADGARDQDAARLCKRLEPGRDVDAVAVDVLALDDDVAEIDADAQRDALFLGQPALALGDAPLHFDRALHRLDHAREFHERAVAHQLDDAAVQPGHERPDEVRLKGLQAGKRPGFVGGHEPRVADHIGSQDRRQPSGHSIQSDHGGSTPILRKSSMNLGSEWRGSNTGKTFSQSKNGVASSS